MTTALHESCFKDFKSWLRKHKKAILITAGVAGAGVCTYYWWTTQKSDSKDEQQELKKFEKDAEVRAVAQIQNHFESIQEISDSTTLPSVLSHVKLRLFELVDLSVLTNKLMAGKEASNDLAPKEKVQIWQELKVLSFTRTACALWAVSLLDLFIRIQLNILGRHVYIGTSLMSDRRPPSSVAVHLQNKKKAMLAMSCQHKYIAFADYLPHKGIESLVKDMHMRVERVVKIIPLKQLHTVDQLRDVFERVKCELETSGMDWAKYVLPEDNILPEELAQASSVADAMRSPEESSMDFEEEGPVDDQPMLDSLMDETRAILASPEFQGVLSSSLEAVLEGVMEDLRPLLPSEDGTPLAKLLPPVASIGSSLLETAEGNKYVTTLADMKQLKDFCALIYADYNT
eukprot:TRINITY_DN15409_c0_g1_i1.p1 TRINITY_DN15409_c0_g1~~TRINITY_DN15409_c0_g1_i1.p1  ORF type:complete len:401 (-),score=82.62 TRINITY_DN15409_c0_g1_i1:203-1405(-)